MFYGKTSQKEKPRKGIATVIHQLISLRDTKPLSQKEKPRKGIATESQTSVSAQQSSRRKKKSPVWGLQPGAWDESAQAWDKGRKKKSPVRGLQLDGHPTGAPRVNDDVAKRKAP